MPEFAAELVVPAGEASKNRAQWSALSDQLLDLAFGRDSAIVALGGGMIGDLAGFVAATYLRGIPCLQVPTTLLAMLDASVGGKTGVDTPHGKNLIGAFHPPAAVLADPLVLRTLPEREYRAGLAEAVKHGLIADAAYFAWLGASADAIARRDETTLATLVRRSVEIKAAVVGEDERESGRRAILNAGHTVAHAVEHASDYALAHGEAVALGLVAECELAEAMGIGRRGLGADVSGLLGRLGLPVRLDQGAAARARAGGNGRGQEESRRPRAVRPAARRGDHVPRRAVDGGGRGAGDFARPWTGSAGGLSRLRGGFGGVRGGLEASTSLFPREMGRWRKGGTDSR